jgi:hypothetical protein
VSADCWYVLRCLACDEESGLELDIPFDSAEDRRTWMTDHGGATGHDRWEAFDVPKDPARWQPPTFHAEGLTVQRLDADG